MKVITLRSLELSQFQRFDYYRADFSASRTLVRGDNGTGKTTLYTAMMWLMFGKDAFGRKVFDTRRLAGGKPDLEADTSVTGRVTVNGKTVTLRRALHAERDRAGVWRDTTLCWINDVPKLVGEYAEYINTLCPEEEFRMLTSVNYFLSLDTTAQRDYLCTMAGLRSVEDIIRGDSRKEGVWGAKPEDVTLDDWAKSLKATLRRTKEDMAAVPTTIKALTESKPEERDWATLEHERTALKEAIAGIAQKLASLDSDIEAQVAERTAIFTRKQEKDAELRSLALEKEHAVCNANTDRLHAYNAKEAAYRELVARHSAAARRCAELEQSKASTEARISRLGAELERLLEEYNAEAEKQFTPECPFTPTQECKIIIEGAVFEEYKARFEERRKELMGKIMAEGRAKKKELDEAEAALSDINDDAETAAATLRSLDSRVETTRHPEKPTDNAEAIATDYNIRLAALREEAEALAKQYEAFTVRRDDSGLRDEQQRRIADLEAVTKSLAAREQIENIDRQIAETEQRGRDIADRIVELTNAIDTIADINRAVVTDAEQRINALFTVTQWETSAQQKNGAYKDICRPTVDGVSASLNTATRINVGLDICAAISEYKQVRVPLFLDGKESVNDPVSVPTQTIYLEVAPKGTPLTITPIP